MRILHCLHASPELRAAGVEVYTRTLAQALRERHEIALLYPAKSESGTMSVDAAPYIDGVRHFEIAAAGPPRSFEATYRRENVLEPCEEVLDFFRPDVLHVQHLMGLSSDLPALAQARNIPVVMTVHDHWLECAAGGQRFHRDLGRCSRMTPDRCASCTAHLSTPALRARAWLARAGIEVRAPHSDLGADSSAAGRNPYGWRELRRSLQRRAVHWTRVPLSVQRKRLAKRRQSLLQMTHEVDRFLAPSGFVQDAIESFGIPPSSVQRIDFGLADSHHLPRRSLPDRVRVFGYVGSITPHKGIHRLIDAMNELPPQAELQIFGDLSDDPAYAASLRRRARHPGIRFEGGLAPGEVPQRLRALECLVVPSLWYENAPLVIREAFCAGIPVVASNLGGHPELLSRGAGILYDPDTPGELTSALGRLMHESGLARSLADAQPRVETMGEHAREMSAIYRDLVAEIMSPGRNSEAAVHVSRYPRVDRPSPTEEGRQGAGHDSVGTPA
ncbi:MAG: glycosyltransferase family 4 protein [bacterium]|nr:glycosyltransferase family 4 protein [bacterium]